MALDTPPHRQIRDERDMVHPLNVAVAFAARDAAAVVRFVTEMHEARKNIDAPPRNRFARLPVRAHLADLGVLDVHDAVASHAAFNWRYAGKWRAPRRGVTEVAAQLVVGGVDEVAEINWLCGGVGFRCGGPPYRDEQQRERADNDSRRATMTETTHETDR